MKTERYSRGPWRVSGCMSGANHLVVCGGLISPIICEVMTDGRRLPDAANARLIAAAPDLLEACVQAAYILDAASQDKDRVSARGGQHAAEVCRAAIAKATGIACPQKL